MHKAEANMATTLEKMSKVRRARIARTRPHIQYDEKAYTEAFKQIIVSTIGMRDEAKELNNVREQFALTNACYG